MFTINGRDWDVVFAPARSKHLLRSDGSLTVGVTDGGYDTVFIADNLSDEFLRKVFCHELCYCFCMSYNITIPIQEEEFLADFVATYGEDIIYLLDDLMPVLLRYAA